MGKSSELPLERIEPALDRAFATVTRSTGTAASSISRIRSVVPTSGGHNRFPPGTLEQPLEGLGAAIDAVGGRFTMRYAAVAVTARRG